MESHQIQAKENLRGQFSYDPFELVHDSRGIEGE
jgi:hypothetical protein